MKAWIIDYLPKRADVVGRGDMLQKLERYVTSPGYGLDREFRELEEE